MLVKNTTCEGVGIRALRDAHPAIRRRVLQMWFEEARGASLESVHLQALFNLAESGDTTARVALPTGVSAYCTARGRLTLTKTKPQPIGEYTLPLMLGEQKINNTDISISVTPVELSNLSNKEDRNTLILVGEWEDLNKTLTWRNRREGDVILRGKMHRKLRRLYAQMGMPTELRRALPLLTRGEEIVWAPFVGSADELEKKIAKDGTSSAFKIEINVPNHAF